MAFGPPAASIGSAVQPWSSSMLPSVFTTASGLSNCSPVPVTVAWQPVPLAPVTGSLMGASDCVAAITSSAWAIACAWPLQTSTGNG